MKKTKPKTEMNAYNNHTGNNRSSVRFSFKVSKVIGITMAPDGKCFANLKGFRQARILATDYFELKENRSS